MSKKIFYSPLLRLACACYLLGVFVSPLINWQFTVVLLISCFLVLLFSRKYFFLIICTLFFIGIVQFRLAELSMNNLENSIWQQSQFVGKVVTYPKPQQHGIQSIIKLSSYPYSIALTTNHELTMGDSVSFSCFLNRPFTSNQFNQKMMLWNKGVSALCTTQDLQVLDKASIWNPLWVPSQLRQIMNTKFEQLLESDLAGLYQGILLGNTAKLSDPVKQKFKDTGTTHVMAVSGFNVSIMIAMVAFLGATMKLKRRLNLFLSLGAIFLLWGMVGSSASVVRAVLMGIMVLLATYNYRYANRRTILIIVATVMAVINPFAVRYDIGFQLSFVATYALIVVTPQIERIFFNVGRKSNIEQFFCTAVLPTLVAYTATAPLIWFYFGRISWTAIMTNLIIAPMIPILMAVGMICVVTSFVFPWMATLSGLILKLFSQLFILIVAWFSNVENQRFWSWQGILLALAYIIFALLFIYFWKRKTRHMTDGFGAFRRESRLR